MGALIISDLGPRKNVFVKYAFFGEYIPLYYEESGFKTLVYKNGTKVSHIYGIRKMN